MVGKSGLTSPIEQIPGAFDKELRTTMSVCEKRRPIISLLLFTGIAIKLGLRTEENRSL